MRSDFLSFGLSFLTVTVLWASTDVVPASEPSARPVTVRSLQDGTALTASSLTLQSQAMLTVTVEGKGTTASGQSVNEFTLKNSAGMTVKVLELGGVLTEVSVPDRQGKAANVVLSLGALAQYERNPPYFGGICGRFANRIENAKFTLEGKTYSLFANNGAHALHGGKSHFMTKVWKSAPIVKDQLVGVALTYVSADGEEGFPGTLTTKVTYTLNDKNELAIEYTATTDKATVLNLTNHAYWNLRGDGKQTVLDYDLQLFADRYLPVNETAIPTGELAPVAGTCMDFRQPAKIGARIAETVHGGGGYDHCWVVNGEAGKLRPVARVVDSASGRVMEISTTEPGVQFYTGNFLDGSADNGGAIKQGALCLECQHYPNSPNTPSFPTTRLNPGETYHQTTVHKFSVQP